ncbi:MAG: MBOAT family protein [Chloroflexi bacterium]|nr:MBOAT family protein [Chloroflexota bacterium]
MLFNSFSFLIFFTILVVVYYIIPHRFRWVLLVLASLYFYSTFNVGYVLLLLASALVAYAAGLGLGASQGIRKKAIFIVGVLVSLAPLVVYKYVDFFADSLNALVTSVGASEESPFPKLGLLLPAGLSFFTFSCVSYLIDVYRGQIPAERNAGHLALYVCFFPKLLAGPIERATAFLPQLLRPVRLDPENITAGLQLIMWGLFKKVVIADRLALLVDATYKRPSFASPVDLVIATYFFAFQIYCDFSGYSDIAIGLARVLGINLMENFRRPYLASSVPEFWGKDRWHISLNRWFRDYMYFPMGGSRVSKLRSYFNLMAVFVVSGLWHGANWTFVIWGGLNAVYQIVTLATGGIRGKIGKILHLSPPGWLHSLVGGLVTFHLILIAWVFFRAASFDDAVTVFSRVATALPNLPTMFAARPYSEDIILSVVFIALLLLVEVIDEQRTLWERLRASPVYVRWAFYYAVLACLIIFGKWGLAQFVYMQF